MNAGRGFKVGLFLLVAAIVVLLALWSAGAWVVVQLFSLFNLI